MLKRFQINGKPVELQVLKDRLLLAYNIKYELIMHNVNLRDSVFLAVASYLEILDGEIPSGGIYKVVTGEVERELFSFVFQHCGRNQSLATKVLGISRATFRKKMTEFGFI